MSGEIFDCRNLWVVRDAAGRSHCASKHPTVSRAVLASDDVPAPNRSVKAEKRWFRACQYSTAHENAKMFSQAVALNGTPNHSEGGEQAFPKHAET